jgi:N-acetylmuramoyl-L-alanine amidase
MDFATLEGSVAPSIGVSMDVRILKASAVFAASLLLLMPTTAKADEESEGSLPVGATREVNSLESLPLVVLDPGHGGPDPGAVGPSGLTEAEVVWTVASALKLVLEREGAARVVLTRTRDSSPVQAERTAKANSQETSLFLSLHLAAAFHAGARGSAAYTASAPGRPGSVDLNGSSAEAFRPTRRRRALPQASKVRWAAVQSPYREDSRRVCHVLIEALTSEGLFDSGGLHEADLPLLQGAAMPSCLVEMATVTHPVEEAALRQETTRRALVDALFRGVKAALEVNP